MADLITLNEVKPWLSIEVTNHNSDTLLSSLISAASGWVSNWINRDILSASYYAILDGSGSNRQMLGDYPITAVSSLKINGNTIPQAVGFYDNGFRFDDKSIILKGYRFERGASNIEVSYTAGYATVPQDLKQVTIELVGYKFKEMTRIGLGSKGIAGETTVFDMKDLKEHSKNLLNNYNKVIPV